MTRYEQKQEMRKEKARETVLKEANTLEGWPEVRGYDFEGEFNFENFMKSYLTTGFQATNLAQAIEIIKEMRREKTDIFLGFTSNVGTSGMRENIKFLVKEKHLKAIATTVGAIEEDIIRVFKPWVLGSWDAKGEILREKGINKTGNIFCPNDRYLYFEKFMNRVLNRLYERQKNEKKIIGIVEFVSELGRELEMMEVESEISKKALETSFTYWAYKNNMPIFCPALPDGSVGDMLYFFKKNNPDFKIDTSDYVVQVTDMALNSKKMGLVCIGGSVPKHLFSNAALFRDGADYAIFINNSTEFDGSNAGTSLDEAISWGKIKHDAKRVKVETEATLVLPLLIAGAFKLYEP